MNRSPSLLIFLLVSSFSQAENYPHLEETQEGMIEKYDQAEALYKELTQYP
jgi:hypothetical protein